MVRIVHEPPKPELIQVTCSHCRAVLEFERTDMQFVSDQRDGSYYWAFCPCCDKSIFVAASKVPTWRSNV